MSIESPNLQPPKPDDWNSPKNILARKLDSAARVQWEAVKELAEMNLSAEAYELIEQYEAYTGMEKKEAAD